MRSSARASLDGISASTVFPTWPRSTACSKLRNWGRITAPWTSAVAPAASPSTSPTATNAHVTGLDFIPEAIRQAQARTTAKADRLAFVVGDIGELDFPPGSFDTLISIDTLYFTDLASTLARMVTLLTPGGQMLIYYSHGANPEQPLAVFPLDTLPSDKTPLAGALHAQGLAYRTWDVTAEDYQHAQLKRRVLEELHPAFAAEDNLFLFENRYGEACGVIEAIEANAHKRYLYHVVV